MTCACERGGATLQAERYATGWPIHLRTRPRETPRCPSVDLRSLQRPVRQVVMPRRRFQRSRLLHQDMLVEQVDLARAHEPPGDRGGRRVAQEVAIFRDAPPTAIVAEEQPGLAVRRVALGERARRGCVRRRGRAFRSSAVRLPGAGTRRRRGRSLALVSSCAWPPLSHVQSWRKQRCPRPAWSATCSVVTRLQANARMAVAPS